MTTPNFILSAAISLGIAISGWFVGQGIVDSRADERYVSVLGLAEKQVEADRAVWSISFISASNELSEARDTLSRERAAVFTFLDHHKIDRVDTELQNLRVLDQLARTYSAENIARRYLLQQTVLVRTSNIKAVAAASQDIGALLDQGVLLGTIEGYSANDGPQYIYTRLNEIKPQMIGEATANARLAAQKFAKDADAEIAGIRRARQGRFEILPAENAAGIRESSQIHKTIRVVTTIDYILGL